MTPLAPMCVSCRRYTPADQTCAAFPDGVPQTVLESKVDHRQPMEGDHGLQWTGDRFPEGLRQAFEAAE